MKKLFTYTGYRDLIRDFYLGRKKADKKYSYQVFAKGAGFASKGYLIDIIGGKKHLAKGSIFKVALAMGLNKKETDYFEALVHFNQAASVDEREYYFNRLKAIAGKSNSQLIGGGQFEYFSEWYHPVIRELVVMKDFNGDIPALAKRLRPAITPKQARESIELLQSLKLIKKTASNRYVLSDSFISTGDEIKSLAVQKFQKKNLELAREALDRFPPEERDVSTLTASVSKDTYQVLKKEIQLFRKHLAEILNNDANQDRVCQVNFQLFPLTEA